ncbi:RNA demethylase ALKBH10B-like [Solanum verrucosum]|uniref:RNA demethylase ALKBH10B-like n=1 Tax=Solanum verrucosum TaxID=315347 RepID=UPI0020D17A64|nr:RNA demethylase ALKBH10B-like [Solanum verrucosum]
MPPAAGVVANSDRVSFGNSMVIPTAGAPVIQQPPMTSETFAKDAIIAWFRGEFAAANAIIDALCNHITQLEGDRSEYEPVFSAIHRRRLNWIPILQMQKYYSIADVTLELRKLAARKVSDRVEVADVKQSEVVKESFNEKINCHDEESENAGGEVVDVDSVRDDSNGSPESEITDTGSQEVQHFLDSDEFCTNHENCEARHDQMKMTKGFVSKEPVKGHMVNVVRGLKLFEDVFTTNEISKLDDLVNELRVAGQNGELSGETFILYNQQVKGSKRELIQLGAPIFEHVKEDAACQKSHNEPIPALLQGVINHLIQWHLISENRRPNSCIINFFDEGEYSQPFLKPPHLEQPVSTLVLADSMMAFGRTLVSDSEGNYKGSLMLSLKEGSLLVMRGNSADMARHAMCSSPNKRVTITFFKVRTEMGNNFSEAAPLTRAMTIWQPGVPTQYATANRAHNGYEPMDMIPKWGGVVRSPVVMLAPLRPVVMNPRRAPRGGTGVFLPWNGGSRKPAKHLPPRAQRGRFLALPPPGDSPKSETASEPSLDLDGKSP